MCKPFAYFSHPRIKMQPGLQFEIGKWLSPYAERLIINNVASFPDADSSAAVILDLAADYALPSERSSLISPEEYLVAVKEVIESCKKRNGKTVFSRIIQQQNKGLDPILAANRLTREFPDALCFLFATQDTGCWLGATPETLLNFDYNTRRIETMAYAGTRPYQADAQWDEKNLRENLFVAEHIVNVFNQFGIDPEVSAPYSSCYGALQHLRRDISATLPQEVEYWELLDALNPTPALCGTPTDAAITDISRYEHGNRDCYGGFIALHKPGEFFHSRVCLRCAQICQDGYFEIHTGGGITPDSNPISEYRETEAKAASLQKILLSSCKSQR